MQHLDILQLEGLSYQRRFWVKLESRKNDGDMVNTHVGEAVLTMAKTYYDDGDALELMILYWYRYL